MKTIPITDDIYDHILKNTSFIGEDASSILKRLLRLTDDKKPFSSVRPAGPSAAGHDMPTRIDECLASLRVQAERNAVGKFLAILSWLFQKHRTDFEKILMIEGTRRKYFGRSEQELEATGSSVNAQRIPDSPFWVVTNNDTPKKARMLGDVLRILGYSAGDLTKAARFLD